MDKLQYDSLYKFLVSLGIILITLPIAALAYLIKSEPILISQEDFDALSEYSQQMIVYKDSLTSYFIDIFPWFGMIFICFGLFFLGYGICKWKSVQKNLDKKLDAEATMQTLSLMEMSSKEVEDKVTSEIKEDTAIETVTENSSVTADTQLSQITKYLEVENLCFKYFTNRYLKKYSFKRNIRMGKCHYDFIGVSKHDNIDLLFEIKYIKSAAGNSRKIYDVFERVYDSGVIYETIAHRNFRCIVVIVTPKEELPRLENTVETYCKAHRDNASKIEIKCMAEESL